MNVEVGQTWLFHNRAVVAVVRKHTEERSVGWDALVLDSIDSRVPAGSIAWFLFDDPAVWTRVA